MGKKELSREAWKGLRINGLRERPDSLQSTPGSPEVEGELAILEKNLAVWRRDLERTATGREVIGTESCAIVTNNHSTG